MKKIFLLSAAVAALVLALLFCGKQVFDSEYAALYQCALIGSGVAAFAVSVQRHLHNPKMVLGTFFGGLLPCLFAWQTTIVYIVGVIVLSMMNRKDTWRQLDAFCQE